MVIGYNYGFIGLENTKVGIVLEQVTRNDADQNAPETRVATPIATPEGVWLKASFAPMTVDIEVPSEYRVAWPAMSHAVYARVSFSYSLDGKTWTSLGAPMVARPGRWVGAQVGLFSQSPTGTPSNVSTRVGYAAFEAFHIGN